MLQSYGWNQQKINQFRSDLLAWYDANKRDLPWRRDNNPYYIWISEIMLQQTQVATVIPYFERFIATIPDIATLAQVDEQVLLQLWQGLGYYSRARNLKIAAQQIVEKHGGEMPKTMPELLALKGIGPYTAAAIGSMAFNLPEPAIDGNLLRVTARLFELDADIAKPSSRKQFAAILYELIDPKRPGDFNQAMMDLGATIMTPTNYYPENSPVKDYDASFINETAENYPVKSKKVKQTHHTMIAYYIQDSSGNVLYRQHLEEELLTGLWHFPMVEYDIDYEAATQKELLEPLAERYRLDWLLHDEVRVNAIAFPVVKHVFSHRVWHVQLISVTLTESNVKEIPSGWQWVSNQDWLILPISTLQKKLEQVRDDRSDS
ncbi:A/G-specific adenine glycosylase [Tuanshanicoccus yangjingiae]|nr:A/G-specific adenine glycosylase [Facklamia sp. 252]NEW67264.1 A/G-specific adenine glycosylase [Facklamia sp. 253]QQD66534.1 A/G-specific adenine glycosylase [Aerococcaceae bacterium zg-252]